MREFMAFRDDSVKLVSDVFSTAIAESQRESSHFNFFPSREFLITIASVLNMYVLLDSVKNMKASMNNDFSLYKR